MNRYLLVRYISKIKEERYVQTVRRCPKSRYRKWKSGGTRNRSGQRHAPTRRAPYIRPYPASRPGQPSKYASQTGRESISGQESSIILIPAHPRLFRPFPPLSTSFGPFLPLSAAVARAFSNLSPRPARAAPRIAWPTHRITCLPYDKCLCNFKVCREFGPVFAPKFTQCTCHPAPPRGPLFSLLRPFSAYSFSVITHLSVTVLR